MGFVSIGDGTQIFYKDWGPKDAQPIVFHHGWPLSADDWDNQMLFFVGQGFRVIATTAVATAARHRLTPATRWTPTRPTSSLSPRRSISGARSMSATRPGRRGRHATLPTPPPVASQSRAYRCGAAHHGEIRDQPGGLAIEVFDGFRVALATNRAQFYRDVPAGPFYGYNRAGAQVSEGG